MDPSFKSEAHYNLLVELSPKRSGAGSWTRVLKAKRITTCWSNYPRSGAGSWTQVLKANNLKVTIGALKLAGRIIPGAERDSPQINHS
jgi:hypothetical protein